jgi:mannosyl-oligosaccharide alpha-1,2-mannosidase
MTPIYRKLLLVAALFTLAVLYTWTWPTASNRPSFRPISESVWQDVAEDDYFWNNVVTNYPRTSFKTLPTGTPRVFPKVQANFPAESEASQQTRIGRQRAVKDTLLRCWRSYRDRAWMADELNPVSGQKSNHFGGWAATLVDALDTLWIMGLHTEFNEAVKAAEQIDFTHTDLSEVNVFETTIRYLGGFLAAFELSGDTRLLRKAVQIGEMVYKAFDTPNHLPITRWDFRKAAKGEKQVAGSGVLVAEIGSLCMELTRLSQHTGEPKWFDAVQRITDIFAAQQDSTELPGMWPLVVDAKDMKFNRGNVFTLGAMADSTYEYLPKMAALTGGQLPIYQRMYEKAMNAATRYTFFKPLTPTNEDILVSGQARTTNKGGKFDVELEHQGQHLVCFIGGNLALGGKLFNRPQDVRLGEKLTDGCIYAYKSFPHGVMPETFAITPCVSKDCKWDETAWKQAVLKAHDKPANTPLSQADTIIANERLPPGFSRVPDGRYILRPEAIESVFMLYRITARQDLPETAWDMFTAIEKITKTDLASSAVDDVTVSGGMPLKLDSMESFWMGETLKYFYLMFSEPDVISLDEWVFNTEAHPLRRLK